MNKVGSLYRQESCTRVMTTQKVSQLIHANIVFFFFLNLVDEHDVTYVRRYSSMTVLVS